MTRHLVRRLAGVLLAALLLSACLSVDDSCACQRPAPDVPYEIYVLSGPGRQATLRVERLRLPPSGNPGMVALPALMTWRPESPADGLNGFALLRDEPITRVRSVSHRHGVVTVDLTRSVWDPYPTADLSFRVDGELVMQQLVWTVQRAIRTTDPVLLTVRGRPARGVWLHSLDGPVGRDRTAVGESGKIDG